MLFFGSEYFLSVLDDVFGGIDHGLLGDLSDDGATVHTGVVVAAVLRSGDDTDASVLRVVLGEIADEGHAVARTHIASVLEELGGAGLACDRDEFALRLSLPPLGDGSGAEMIVPDDIVEALLDFAEGGGAAETALDGLGTEGPDDLVVLANLADEDGRYHLAVVGDAVVEEEGVEGTHLDGVSIGHAGDGDGVVGYVDARLVGTGNDVVDAVAEPHAVEFVDESACAAVVAFGDDFRHGDVAADGECVADTIYGVVGMRVGVACIVVHPAFLIDLDAVVEVDLAVVECRHECDGLEGGPGFDAHDGVVGLLGVGAVGVSVEVADGLDFSRSDLHEGDASPVGIGDVESPAEGGFADVEEIGIERGVDVAAIDGIFDGHVAQFAGDGLAHTDAIGAAEVVIEAFFDADISVSALAIDRTDGAAAEAAKRLDAAMEVLEMEAALVVAALDEGELLDLLLLDIGDATGVESDVLVLVGAAFVVVGIDHDTSVLLRGLVADDGAEPLGDGVHVLPEEFAVVHSERLDTGVHVDAVLRDTAGEEPSVGVVDVASHGGYGLGDGLELVGDTLPLPPLDGLEFDDARDDDHEECGDHQEDDCKSQDRIFDYIAHGWCRVLSYSRGGRVAFADVAAACFEFSRHRGLTGLLDELRVDGELLEMGVLQFALKVAEVLLLPLGTVARVDIDKNQGGNEQHKFVLPSEPASLEDVSAENLLDIASFHGRVALMLGSFSATRSLALRALGFRSTSCGEAVMPFSMSRKGVRILP